MLIGLKFDIGYSQNEVYRRLYGQREILPFLKGLGVQVLETPVGPETQPHVLSEHIAHCVDAGMQITLHPYSEGSIFNLAYFADSDDNPCRALHERFFSLAAEATKRQQSPTLVNLHGAAGTSADSREHLVERSAAFFRWARDWCSRNAPEVSVAVELQISPNADESRQRVGDTYEELLEVATQGDVLACWDFGHAYWNTRRYEWPLYPPQALIPRIGHVHCHDVCGDDHQPLIYDAVPWREFIKLLIDNGFDSRIVLEVPPSEFLRAGGIHTLVTSLESLGAWVRRCQSGAPSS